jgi:hypothetical protein
MGDLEFEAKTFVLHKNDTKRRAISINAGAFAKQAYMSKLVSTGAQEKPHFDHTVHLT